MLYWLISKLVHTLIGPIICTLQKQCIDQNNVTYVSMATKYPIIKHRAFFKTLTFFISTNNEDIGQKLITRHLWPHINVIQNWKVKVQGHAKDTLV